MEYILINGFSGISDTDWIEDLQMIKDKLIDGKKVMGRFKGKLVKIIKEAGSKFDDYSISPKIRQILLHWDSELTEKDFLMIWQINE